MDKAPSFLQSEAWEAVQQAYGRTTKRIDGVLAIRHRWYWFIPHGPLVQGLADGAVCVRYEPDQLPVHDRRVADVHPSKTLITALDKPAVMLANLKPKCRYNLHLAEKKNLTIVSNLPTASFFNVLTKTSQRQHITLHPQRYYHTIVDTLKPYDMVKVYGVEYQQQIIAVGLMIYYAGTATYVHGGSDYQHRSLMAPYLLHWQVMQDAWAAGMKQYDWFGISDRWPGVSRFKLGWGGEIVSRPGTFEHPLRPLWYTAYRLTKRLWT